MEEVNRRFCGMSEPKGGWSPDKMSHRKEPRISGTKDLY